MKRVCLFLASLFLSHPSYAQALKCDDNAVMSLVCKVGSGINGLFHHKAKRPSADVPDTSTCPSPVFVNASDTGTTIPLVTIADSPASNSPAPPAVPAATPTVTGCGAAPIANHYGLFNMPLHLLNSASSQGEVRVQALTQDSSVKIQGNLDPSELSLVVKLTNEATGEIINQYIPVQNCNLDTKIYFPSSGKYKIDIWASKSANAFDVSQTKYEGQFEVDNQDTRDTDGLLPSALVQSDSPEIIALAQSITARATTDREKAQAIHDWVASNTQYDAKAYFSQSYKNNTYDALSVLHSHLAICDGYGHLFAALARASGLRTHVVHGNIIWPELGQSWNDNPPTMQTHTWDQVLVDGRWIDVDATWDSGFMNFSTQQFTSQLQEKFFDPSASDLAKSHQFTTNTRD